MQEALCPILNNVFIIFARHPIQQNYQMMKKDLLMTQVMIMEKLNISRKQVQKDIKELQEESVLVREGSNRNGRWIVKK